jgi:hypothetical protein
MRFLQRSVITMVMGVTLLVGLSGCVVAPMAPAPSGYVVSPPVVIVRPYRMYRPYHPYRAYRPYYGGYPYAHRW